MPQSVVCLLTYLKGLSSAESFVKGGIKYEVSFVLFMLSVILVLKICIISVIVLLASTDYQGSS